MVVWTADTCNVGAGVSKTPYLGTSSGGCDTGGRDSWGGTKSLVMKSWRRVGIICLVFIVYFVSGRGVQTRHDFFIPLAESFLQGKTYVEKMRYELHEMVSETEILSGIYQEPVDGVRDKYYVILPPLPAVILMPFVGIWGESTNQSLVSMLIAAIGVYVASRVFMAMKLKRDGVLWLTVLYGFGSSLWYHAVVGSAWYFASVCALLFLWLAVWLTLKKKSLWLVGMVVGLAYLCRYNLVLTTPFFLYMTREQWMGKGKQDVKLSKVGKLVAGVVVAMLLSFGYNYVRYGRIDHFGYTILEGRAYNVQNEYAQGSYSLSYVGRHLKAAGWSFPQVKQDFPYLVPNMRSMALWIVFPAILLVLGASWKSRLVQAGTLGIILLLPSTILHGGVGASQFGYRYIFDYLPFIFLIIGEAVRKRFGWGQKGLIILSIIINIWGMWLLM